MLPFALRKPDPLTVTVSPAEPTAGVSEYIVGTEALFGVDVIVGGAFFDADVARRTFWPIARLGCVDNEPLSVRPIVVPTRAITAALITCR